MKSIILFVLLLPLLAGAANNPSNVMRLGNGSTTGNKRIIMNRGSSNPELRWNEATGKMQVSNDGSVFSDIPGSAPDQSYELNNLGFAASISSNTLVVALKTKAASDASGSDPIKVGFRSSTATTGNYTQVTFTAANSITLGTTDSIGIPASIASHVYVYLISDTTSEICLSAKVFDEGTVQSATALTGGADTSATTLYCASAHTSKPIRSIGTVDLTWSNPNWGSITEASVTPRRSIQKQQLPATNITASSSSGSFTTTNTTATDVTNLSVTLTTNGGPVQLFVIGAVNVTNPLGCYVENNSASHTFHYGFFNIIRTSGSGTGIGNATVYAQIPSTSSTTSNNTACPSGIDTGVSGTPGTYTWKMQVQCNSASQCTTIGVGSQALWAREL